MRKGGPGSGRPLPLLPPATSHRPRALAALGGTRGICRGIWAAWCDPPRGGGGPLPPRLDEDGERSAPSALRDCPALLQALALAHPTHNLPVHATHTSAPAPTSCTPIPFLRRCMASILVPHTLPSFAQARCPTLPRVLGAGEFGLFFPHCWGSYPEPCSCPANPLPLSYTLCPVPIHVGRGSRWKRKGASAIGEAYPLWNLRRVPSYLGIPLSSPRPSHWL